MKNRFAFVWKLMGYSWLMFAGSVLLLLFEEDIYGQVISMPDYAAVWLVYSVGAFVLVLSDVRGGYDRPFESIDYVMSACAGALAPTLTWGPTLISMFIFGEAALPVFYWMHLFFGFGYLAFAALFAGLQLQPMAE